MVLGRGIVVIGLFVFIVVFLFFVFVGEGVCEVRVKRGWAGR